jgi:hypothetical protein
MLNSFAIYPLRALVAALCSVICPASPAAPQDDWASLAARIKKIPEQDGKQLETLLNSVGLNHSGCRASSGIPVELDCGSPAGLHSIVAIVDGTHLGPKDTVTDISIRFVPHKISERPLVAALTRSFAEWTQAFEFNEQHVRQMQPPSCLASLVARGSQWKVRVGIVGHDYAGHCANDVEELSLRITRVTN